MEKNIKKESATFLAVEEHAANLQVSAPVFQAVMQAQNWAA